MIRFPCCAKSRSLLYTDDTLFDKTIRTHQLQQHSDTDTALNLTHILYAFFIPQNTLMSDMQNIFQPAHCWHPYDMSRSQLQIQMSDTSA